MHDGRKTLIEKTWLAVGVTSFVLHRLMEATSTTDGIWFIEAIMVVLSFPFGVLAMFFLALGVHELREVGDASWILDWSTLLFIGYIQWFVVLPEIRRNNTLVTLNLTFPAETASPITLALPVEIVSSLNSASPANIASPVEIVSSAPPPDTSTPREAPRVVFNAADFVPPFAEFDEAGLTALDRVLRAPRQAPPPAAQAPPATDELIFPAALPARV